MPPTTPDGFPIPLILRPGQKLRTIPFVLGETRVRELLTPFGLDPTTTQAKQILAYLQLLLRWNQRINLTAIREPENCVTRHFGESLFLARHAQLAGDLLDIGSGAGFPGLALKIVFPEISVTLLEPVAKKRAFLKEAARVCGFHQVEVRGERLQEWASTNAERRFDSATMRAVGNLGVTVPLAARCLKTRGNLFLWLAHDQANVLAAIESGLCWDKPIAIPLSRSGEVWKGIKNFDSQKVPTAGSSDFHSP